MACIQVLSPHVADLIAAGEVVERPASVVKELLENAIDAGATAVTVEIQNGGMTYIRVTDDGSGIPPGEAETAFLRHATSKLRTEHDLEAIGTLGFRGEALAAIAAVSRTEVLTRTGEGDFGISLTLEGGTVTGREEAGCPQGTTMVVRDLFFNTPARLKYMKKDSAEGAAVFAAVQREALAHPEVAVRFLRDGRQELQTPGDGELRSAVYAVLGRDLALGFTPVKGSGEDGISVEGFVSLPACCRGSRNYQYFFVNGRFIKSRLLMAALEEAYRNQKMVGKFPGCVLGLTTRLNRVDVNVHPAKTEVKFVSEKKIFDAVYHAVKGTLEGEQARPRAVIAAPKTVSHDTVTPNQTAFRTLSAEEFRKAPEQKKAGPVEQGGSTPYYPLYGTLRAEQEGGLPLHDFLRPRFAEDRAKQPVIPVVAPAPQNLRLREEPPRESQVEALAAVEHHPQEPVPEKPSGDPGPTKPEKQEQWVLRGELFHTYILVERGDTVYFIDKHAAHERMNFDRLKAQGYEPMVQQLLTPVVFTPAPEEGAALLRNQEILSRLGFSCEDFGGGAVLVRQAPDYVEAGEIEGTLLELAADLAEEKPTDPEGVRDALLATMSCKAAIKGGWRSGKAELERVAEAVLSGQVRYCPHGRPVAIEMTQKELEKQFKRV